jgi:hypothetical protein
MGNLAAMCVHTIVPVNPEAPSTTMSYFREFESASAILGVDMQPKLLLQLVMSQKTLVAVCRDNKIEEIWNGEWLENHQKHNLLPHYLTLNRQGSSRAPSKLLPCLRSNGQFADFALFLGSFHGHQRSFSCQEE